MTGIAPERLLSEWLGEDSAAVEAVIYAEPFHVPYDRLARIDGWVLWLGHPPVPEGIPLLPGPERLLYDEPAVAIATALLVAADYAVRRGAWDPETATAILAREGPVAIATRGDLHRSLAPIARRAEEAGLTIVATHGEIDADTLREQVLSFDRRARAHAVDLGRAHDPIFSFQPRASESVIGGNNLSTFLVHDDGRRDGCHVFGAIGPAVAIDIGLPPDAFDVFGTAAWEPVLESIPCFLDGVTSWRQGDSLAIGWRLNDDVSAETIARAFHTWTKALTSAAFVDVRIAFAEPGARSEPFDQLRSHAASYNDYREAALAGHPDPRSVVDREMIE